MNKKLLLGLSFALFFSACSPQPTSSGQTPAATQNQESAVTISIENYVYSPQELRAKPGQAITFTNKDAAPHSVTSDTGEFDSGIIGQNETATFTAPTTPGTYPFYCLPHPNIIGTLIVE